MQRELVERAMGGDHDAFSELARVSVGRLLVIARLILHDEAAAEDATQEALVAAWRHIRGLRDPDRFEAWLHRLLVNECHREARGRRRLGTARSSSRRSTPPEPDAVRPADGSRPARARVPAPRRRPTSRSSSCTTTSAFVRRRPPRSSACHPARSGRACIARCRRCGPRSTPTLGPGPSAKEARHEPRPSTDEAFDRLMDDWFDERAHGRRRGRRARRRSRPDVASAGRSRSGGFPSGGFPDDSRHDSSRRRGWCRSCSSSRWLRVVLGGGDRSLVAAPVAAALRARGPGLGGVHRRRRSLDGQP